MFDISSYAGDGATHCGVRTISTESLTDTLSLSILTLWVIGFSCTIAYSSGRATAADWASVCVLDSSGSCEMAVGAAGNPRLRMLFWTFKRHYWSFLEAGKGLSTCLASLVLLSRHKFATFTVLSWIWLVSSPPRSISNASGSSHLSYVTFCLTKAATGGPALFLPLSKLNINYDYGLAFLYCKSVWPISVCWLL